MSGEDRLDEMKRLLDSTLKELEGLFKDAEIVEESRIGNGWKPESLDPKQMVIKPIGPPEALRIAESKKYQLFRTRKIFSKKNELIVLGAPPRLRFLPYWRVKGFHECFYFRAGKYRVPVPHDVIAVDVEGRLRDLITEDSEKSFPVKKALEVIARLRRRPEPDRRYFHVDYATELARSYEEAELFLDPSGNPADEVRSAVSKSPIKAQAMDESFPLRFEGGVDNVEIAPSNVSKEDVVRMMHDRVVRPPKVFLKILSNRFEISTIEKIYVPFYSFQYAKDQWTNELQVNGIDGRVLP